MAEASAVTGRHGTRQACCCTMFSSLRAKLANRAHAKTLPALSTHSSPLPPPTTTTTIAVAAVAVPAACVTPPLNHLLSQQVACLVATEILALVGLRSFRTAALLLVGLLAYDVFWVFGSPQGERAAAGAA